MTVGSRHWGRWWDGGGVLNVKLYEFAVYIDQPQVRSIDVQNMSLLTLDASFEFSTCFAFGQ